MCCQSVIKPNVMISMPVVHICIRHLAPPANARIFGHSTRTPIGSKLICLRLSLILITTIFIDHAEHRHVSRDLLTFRHPSLDCDCAASCIASPAHCRLLTIWLIAVLCLMSGLCLHNVNVSGSGRNLQAWDKIRGWESQGYNRDMNIKIWINIYLRRQKFYDNSPQLG